MFVIVDSNNPIDMEESIPCPLALFNKKENAEAMLESIKRNYEALVKADILYPKLGISIEEINTPETEDMVRGLVKVLQESGKPIYIAND